MEDFLYVGRVVGSHGVLGMIKVFPTTDDPRRFELLKEVLIEDPKGNRKKYTIKSVKYINKFVILGLKEISDMNLASMLKQSIIMIPKDQGLPLEKDEYYISDLIGLEVFDNKGNKLGDLKDIIFTGSNDVYVVEDEDKELLLPAIKQCIEKIDLVNKKMIVNILEGLLD